mgnify:CR=1 FL=1
MNQKNGRTDPGPLRERARSLFISQATIDETLEWATPRQLDAIDRMLATELANREASKRARLMRQARFRCPKASTLRLRERAPARRIHQGAADRPRFRGQGAGPRVLRQDGTRKDPPGHRPGHARHRARQEREVPADRGARAPARQGQTRRRPRQPAQGPRPCRPDHPRRVRLRAVRLDGARLLYQIIAGSYERRSIIFTTNIEFSKWGTIFADDKLAAAIIDRIVHHGRLIEFTGPSRRVSQALCSARRTTSKTNHRPALLMPKPKKTR